MLKCSIHFLLVEPRSVLFELILTRTLMAILDICVDRATSRYSRVTENGGHHLNALSNFLQSRKTVGRISSSRPL